MNPEGDAPCLGAPHPAALRQAKAANSRLGLQLKSIYRQWLSRLNSLEIKKYIYLVSPGHLYLKVLFFFCQKKGEK